MPNSEWAGTERLVELGGRYVDNTVVPQYLNRDSTEKKYQDFLSRYRQRFKQEPGFAGLISYNATNIVLEGLEKDSSRERLKETLLSINTFEGVGSSIEFDQFGDASSKTFVTEIHDGKFRILHE